MDRETLLGEISDLIDRHQDRHVALPYDTGMFSLDEAQLGQARGFLDQVADLLQRVRERFEGASQDQLASQIANIAWVGHGQAVGYLEQLQDTRGISVWELGARLDSSRWQARRALVAVEAAMREHLGMAEKERPWVNLEDSIEIRRLYGQLRRSVLGDGEPRSDELPKRLSKIARRIAILRDLKIYPFLRIGDRRELRVLQKRIQTWQADGEDPESGRHLWQDLVNFVELLRQINRREELIELDRRVLNEVSAAAMAAAKSGRPLTAETLERLSQMEGRDRELDELILEPGGVDTKILLKILERLRREGVTQALF